MSYPEKLDRNNLIYFQHLTRELSYRDLQKHHNLKSVKSVYRIVARMKKRHPSKAAFIKQYKAQ